MCSAGFQFSDRLRLNMVTQPGQAEIEDLWYRFALSIILQSIV